MIESEDLKEEIGAIEAIYPECVEKLAPLIYKFKVPQHEHIIFQMSFPINYPKEKPCILDVASQKKGFDEKYLMELFQEVLDSIFYEDEVAIFDLFTELDAVLYTGEENQEALDDNDHWTAADTGLENLNDNVGLLNISPNKEHFKQKKDDEEGKKKDDEEEKEKEDVETENENVDYANYKYDEESEKAKANRKKQSKSSCKFSKPYNPLEGWTITDPIVDRKSTFVGFAKEIHSVEEAYKSFAQLIEDRKVSRANHAMRAWRIKDADTGVQYQDCDDDGETAAGGRMLHLLSVMDAWNVIVVVCRWFGGVHIGPDRFKHINNASRDALIKGGFVEDSSPKKTKKRK